MGRGTNTRNQTTNSKLPYHQYTSRLCTHREGTCSHAPGEANPEMEDVQECYHTEIAKFLAMRQNSLQRRTEEAACPGEAGPEKEIRLS